MASPITATPSKLEAQLTGKAKQLEEDHVKGMSEAERLREEVNRTRALRANRAANRSQKSISNMSGVMSPSSPAPSSTSNPSTLNNSSKPTTTSSHTESSPSPTIHVEPEQKVKLHQSSYPIFTGRVNNNHGTSLANFIGGDTKIKGPILNKVRPSAEDSLLSQEERVTPQATFLARNPALIPPHQRQNGRNSPGVALPGMTKSTPSPSLSINSASQGFSASSSTSPRSPGYTSNYAKPAEKSATDPTSLASSKTPLLGSSADSKPAYDRILSKSPGPMDMDKLSLGDKKPEERKGFPSQIASPQPIKAFENSPAFSASNTADQTKPSSSSMDDTTSLGRLRGASIVKQRLQWGESQNEGNSSNTNNRYTPTNSPKPTSSYKFKSSSDSNTSRASPAASPVIPSSEETRTPIQHKRSSVLDRWNRDTPDRTTTSTSNSASPQASPRVDQPTSKWPKPAYSKPVLGSKASFGAGSTTASPKPDSSAANAPVEEALHSSDKQEGEKEKYEQEKGAAKKPQAEIQEEPKTFQRPVTKPPWMQARDNAAASSPSNSTEAPTRASSFPRPQVNTSNVSSSSASKSPIPPSPKPTRSIPSPALLPISVSPAPYMRSQASPGNATSPRSSVFQPNASSFPVSLGVAPTHSRPLSLAHFIGGDNKVNGPVLNKVRPEETDGFGLETDATSPNSRVGTFLTHNPGVMNEMMKKHRVPMPGMVPSAARSDYDGGSRSPAPPVLSPKPTVQSTSMEKTGSASGTLPLPGMESPKLPLPGQEPILSPMDDSNSNIDTIQPSESNALSEEVISRPSTRAISHEFEKRHNNESYQDQPPSPNNGINVTTSLYSEKDMQESPNEDNAWAAIGSAMLSPSSGEDTVRKTTISSHKHVPSWEGTLKTLGKGPARHAPRPPSSQGTHSVTNASSDSIVVQRPAISKQDLPDFKPSQIPSSPNPQQVHFEQYISVEVLSITDDSKTITINPKEQHILYSTELLAVVLRSKKGGLVTTELVIWKGKHCSEDGSDKIVELEKRYRTSAVFVEQGKENLQIVKALGGRLITRQGFRNIFDVLNSTLYRVQIRGKGLSFIDEVELQASSLCSAYSYIASVFQDLFVWYGRGTPDEESRIALQYAEELSKSGIGPGSIKRKVVHMLEGQESELWNDIMGQEEDYAFANHWRFRLDNPIIAFSPPQFYVVTSLTSSMQLLGDETRCALENGAVFILKTPLESFVIVTPSARGDAKTVAMALKAAEVMAEPTSRQAVPFRPTIHALVLPSLIPRDLQATLRSNILDDLNAPHQPTTMNVVDLTTAWEHLNRDQFYKSEIRDISLLPVGVSPEMMKGL